MITNKYITKIIIVIVTAALLFCLGSMIYADRLLEFTSGRAVLMEYESKLFDRDQIMSVDIQIDEYDWEELLDHAIEENYYECNVNINGTTFYNVGVRPKGNTSLTSIANDPDTNRYSLKLEFDRYVEGQTCFGLDKLVLNNNYADPTNMKEAIVYDMFQYLDADASLYNYAKVSVNGDYWGVYLALEAVEESFLLRNYGVETGELYKPENLDGGGNHAGQNENMQQNMPKGEGFELENPEGKEEFIPEEMPEGKEQPAPEETPKGADFSDRGGGERPNFHGRENGNRANVPDGDNGKGMRSMGGGGSDLNYTDDELSSYTTIWEGAVTDTTDIDHKRVITALKQIHSGTNLEEYLDVDAVLKYMAVHTFAVNLDSLTGNMTHNYYLYESNGRLNILPWDYNLSFGGMAKGKNNSASETINYPIDTPFSGTQFFDSILEDETYLAKYHEYLEQIVVEYIQNRRFDTVYTKIRTQIDDLVKTDPTAFFTYDQYDAAAKMLFQAVSLRAESIKGQLAGTIPSTLEEQQENADALLDTSEIDLSVMGDFNMGVGNFNNRNMQNSPDTELQNNQDMLFIGANTNNSVLKNYFSYGIYGIVLLLAVFSIRLYHRKKRQPKSA